MRRLIMNDLIAWKQSKRRKPLVLRGARQVGKSWILEEFGKTFPNGFVKINFDREPEFAQFFQTTKDVRRILQNLSMATGKAITTDTLIIFDEIQACEEALNSLKYFKEDAPEYYVASAGSLLGLQLSSGFPVGQVDFLEMGPMTFTEFLLADGSENYVQYLSSINEPEAIPDAFFSPLTEKLKQYFVTGGMPESVRVWTEDRDPAEVEKVLADIISKVFRITKPGLPLSGYDDLSAFKVFAVDVGILRRLSHLSTTAFAEQMRLFTEFKGALTENFVYQSLIRSFEVPPRYWAEAPHEVDFVIQCENDIIPVEAKAGEAIKAASMKRYIKDYDAETPIAVRLSMKNLSYDGKILNVPLFMIDELKRLIMTIERK